MSKDDENVDARFINFNNMDDNTFNSKNSLDDSDLSDFNKERLKFYVELNKTVKNNPKILKKLINKYNGVTKRKVYEKDIYRSIINKKNKLKDNDYHKLFEIIKKKLKDDDTTNKTSAPVTTSAQSATTSATGQGTAPAPAAAPATSASTPSTSTVAASAQTTTTTAATGQSTSPAAVAAPATTTPAAAASAAVSAQQGGALDFKQYFSKGDDKGQELIEKFNSSNKKSKKKLIKDLKKEYALNNVTQEDDDTNFLDNENPMQKFINSYYTANKDYKEADKNSDDNKEIAEDKLKTDIIKAVDEFDNDPMNSLDILAIKNDDRIVFIVITFIIRYITLLLVNWCVEIDIVRSFNQAFILFSFIYIIIFWLIVMIINVNISPEYSGEASIIGKVQSVLYYFHFRINDIGRLLVHTLLIILLLIIPIIIKKEEKNNDEPLTYEDRINLYKSLSLFTIFMWIFTSIIASKY